MQNWFEPAALALQVSVIALFAIATSSHHAGLALAIAKANFPEQGALVAQATELRRQAAIKRH
jgi:hypothetical protein